jgi:hypothetical protein
MLTTYSLVLIAALGLAAITPSSRFAVLVMIWSWAVSYFMGMVNIIDLTIFVDVVAFWGLFWAATKGSPKAADAARITALMLLAHFLFRLAHKLGFYIEGVYMWTINALFLAAVFSLVGGKDVRHFVGLCVEGFRSLSGCGPRPRPAHRAKTKEAGR